MQESSSRAGVIPGARCRRPAVPRAAAALLALAALAGSPVHAQDRPTEPTDEDARQAVRAAEEAWAAAARTVEGITLDPPELALGHVRPGTERTAVVTIRNVSAHPMTITESKTSCECTTVDLANTTIQPGGSIPMLVTFEGRVQTGTQRARVWLVFGELGTAELRVHAEIALPVRAEPPYLDATSGSEGEITVSSLDGKPFRILAVDGQTPPFAGFDPLVDQPQPSYRLRWSLRAYDRTTCADASGRRMPGWWVIETDRADCPLLDVRVRHRCTLPPKNSPQQTWVLKQQHVLLGVIRPDESVEVPIDLKWAPDMQNTDSIATVVSKSPEIRAELAKTVRKMTQTTCYVRITPMSPKAGLLYGTVQFVSVAGFEYPLTVIGRIAEE